jgi:hypothetical protein
MRQNHSSLETASTEENTPSVQDLCKAMFLEGARLLGFPESARLPLEAQEEIMEAAGIMAEKLALLLDMQREAREPQLVN